jgi:hypothetical protein
MAEKSATKIAESIGLVPQMIDEDIPMPLCLM